MPAPDLDARQVRRHQRQSDTDLIAFADEVVGIVELEGEPLHGGDRSQRDIALVPIQLDPEHLTALPNAAAHHAGIDHRGGVRTGFRAGQPETRNFFPLGQPRQPIVLLLLRAEAKQQLARAERIRHHRGYRSRDRAGGELADHLRMGVGGKPQPAVARRNDHREELFCFQKVPDPRRQVAQFPVDLPLVEHAADFLDRTIEECLLLRGQPRGGEVQQLGPIRVTAEEVRIPPHVARFDRLALGGGELRQRAPCPPEDRLGDEVAAKGREAHHAAKIRWLSVGLNPS